MNAMRRPSIFTGSVEILGSVQLGASGISTNYPAANDAIFLPVALTRPILVKRLFCHNGSVVSGNVDMGIYSVDGVRLVSIGSTAQAGTSALQFFNTTDIYLSPGQYYLAVVLSSTTGRLGRIAPGTLRMQHYGIYKMASALPLPATVTFATVTASYIPCIGMELMGVL